MYYRGDTVRINSGGIRDVSERKEIKMYQREESDYFKKGFLKFFKMINFFRDYDKTNIN